MFRHFPAAIFNAKSFVETYNLVMIASGDGIWNLRVVSDLHLNPLSQDRNNKFLKFLEQSFSRGDQVIILGDLFDLWFGWKNLFFKFQRDIINRMNDLAESGFKMIYVEGNRDFGISALRGTVFSEVFNKEIRMKWGSRYSLR